jgi:coproporphyrinogen III oxidase
LPHRNETRGIGGIFYEYFSPQEMSFDFHKAVGKSFFNTAMETFEKFHTKEYTDADKAAQQIKRGRYVEFNLLNDRGTRFGLKTGGDTEAILASLPPTADWR